MSVKNDSASVVWKATDGKIYLGEKLVRRSYSPGGFHSLVVTARYVVADGEVIYTHAYLNEADLKEAEDEAQKMRAESQRKMEKFVLFLLSALFIVFVLVVVVD